MNKKNFLFYAFLCITSTSYAQLRVCQNGNIAIQAMGTPQSAISIGDAGRSDFFISTSGDKGGITSSIIGSKQNWSHAGQFFSAINSGNNFCVGLKAEARNLNGKDGNSHRSFGIMGLAGNATSGWNYGLYGKLTGNNNGAGVYGTTENENGIYLNNRYAGYFNGLVGINGNLNVNGSINGVLLGASANGISIANIQEEEVENVIDKFASLTAIPYYKAAEAMETSFSNVENDTIGTSIKLSQLAAQDITKKHYALSAEELETIYPDLVYTQDDGTKGINYMELIPLLIQSINELNAKISKLEDKKQSLKTVVTNEETSNESTNAIDVSLSQNTPNPFVHTTSINTVIPQNTKEACLYICDSKGKQVKKETITECGNVNIKLTSDGLAAGMYLYSLLIDGKIIETKRMIVNK